MDLVSFREEVLAELEGDILPFWLSINDPDGGYFGEVESDGTILRDAPRGEILNARIIWSFSAAYAALAAIHASDWFLSHLVDPINGGVFWSASADGKPLDTKKQLYSQAFAIYAFSELYKVTEDKAVLEVASGLFSIIENKFRDWANGGYIEALSEDFSPLEDMSLSAHDINADKTMNSHLHLMEAYANLYSVWPDPSLKEALFELIKLTCEKIISPSGHLYLYFSKDWVVLPGAISYGHDIETSWLLLECAMAVGDALLVDYVKPYCLALGAAGNEGLLPDGSMSYELFPEGEADRSRQWWVQAETVVGNLWLWKYHSDLEGLPRAISCWNWIKAHLISSCGEWYWGTLADGETPDLANPKAGFWKCPYHNARMCLEVLKLFTDT